MNRDDVIRMAREAGFEQLAPDIEDWVCFTEEIERFAALVAAAARAEENEAIMDEWWMCVQSDLENGVKSLNERAAEKWRKEYPEMARFGDVVRGRDKE